MFKHTGIVRRIDDIGRIVIPKEVRRRFHLHDGDPIEIGESENMIALRKYSILDLFNETSQKLMRCFSKVTDMPVILCNTTHTLYSTMYNFSFSSAAETFNNVLITDELAEAIRDKNNNCIGLKISNDAECMADFVEKVVIKGVAEGALIIPATEKEITNEHRICLRLCAAAIASIAA